MKKPNLRPRHNAQKKYRQTQANKGLVRYELQVHAHTKDRFEAAAKAAAEDYAEPWDERRRLAKARAVLFDQITQGAIQEYESLKAQIEALKAEIKTLSPRLYQETPRSPTTVIPHVFRALPDDPLYLKQLLTKAHQEAQLAKKTAEKYQHHAQQYQALYEAATQYNLELVQQLKKAGLPVSTPTA